MCENIDSIIRARKPVNFHRAYRCFSVDAVMLMCFGASADAAKEPDFRSPIEHAMYAGLELSLLFKHFPLVQRTLARLPVSIAERLNPEFKGYFQMRKVRPPRPRDAADADADARPQMLNDQVRTFLTRGADALDAYQDTIYYRFVVRKDGGAPIPEAELCDEAFVFVNAGTDTVSDALSVGTLNVLGQPAVRARLQAALRAAWPDPERVPRYEDLEGIPYLVRAPPPPRARVLTGRQRAVIKESLRFAQGVIHPMTRMVPPEGTVLSGAYIPGGVSSLSPPLFFTRTALRCCAADGGRDQQPVRAHERGHLPGPARLPPRAVARRRRRVARQLARRVLEGPAPVPRHEVRISLPLSLSRACVADLRRTASRTASSTSASRTSSGGTISSSTTSGACGRCCDGTGAMLTRALRSAKDWTFKDCYLPHYEGPDLSAWLTPAEA